MRILHLTLKRKWFDMIRSGEKREEYREIKPYWVRRLAGQQFDVIRFRNGYSKDAPQFDIDLLGIRRGRGRKEWGGSESTVYILSLGKIRPTTGEDGNKEGSNQ